MKQSSSIILIIISLFSLKSNAQYITIGKGKDSEGNKRAIKDEGFTSDFHKQHNKEIVFMSEPIESDEFTEEDIVTTYVNYGDPLYFRTFLSRSLINEVILYKKPISVFHADVNYKLEITLDDQYKSHTWVDGEFFEKKGVEKRTTWYGVFYHEDDEYNYVEAGFEELLIAHGDKLTPGEHKLEFTLYPAYGGWSSGEIEDELKELDVKSMATGVLTVNFNKPLIDPNDPSFCLPAPKFSDKELEQSMITAFIDRGWKQTPLKAVITGDYYIVRNKYSGIVERKAISGAVGYKFKDGTCKYQTYSFAKEHDGDGFNGKLYLSGIGGTSRIACGCIE